MYITVRGNGTFNTKIENWYIMSENLEYSSIFVMWVIRSWNYYNHYINAKPIIFWSSVLVCAITFQACTFLSIIFSLLYFYDSVKFAKIKFLVLLKISYFIENLLFHCWRYDFQGQFQNTFIEVILPSFNSHPV